MRAWARNERLPSRSRDEQQLRAFLSAFKVWRNATESRCRMLSSREASDVMLKPDRDFIAAVERLEGK